MLIIKYQIEYPFTAKSPEDIIQVVSENLSSSESDNRGNHPQLLNYKWNLDRLARIAAQNVPYNSFLHTIAAPFREPGRT